MKPLVSIIMGSTSDLPVMEKACKWLNDNQIPFEVNALSAHRTPDAVEAFAKGAKERGVKVTLNTDNTAVSKTSLKREYALLRVTPEEERILDANARAAAFANRLVD